MCVRACVRCVRVRVCVCRHRGDEPPPPPPKCTDIFFLRADICQLGVDQRKVNMLAREYCDAAGIKLKPVILSHHMLYGLKEGQAKMSKSDPDSAIFMEDTKVSYRWRWCTVECTVELKWPSNGPYAAACKACSQLSGTE